MQSEHRRRILRANAIYLMLASSSAACMDVAGAFLSRGPTASILTAAPHAGIGFLEAHGLAFILSILLWRAEPVRAWHLTGVAIHTLLGTCNLVFWQIFIATNWLWGGYLTTSLHWVFALLQASAAAGAVRNSRAATGKQSPARA
jgi:hypothetical protein